MDIATGRAEDHSATLPLDASGLPAVAPPTPVAPGQVPGMVAPARDTTGEYQAQAAAGAADVRAAQAAGMAAENGRRAHYGQDILPPGAAYGDPLALPVVPDDANAPSSDFLFAEGDQPGKGT